MFWMNLDRRWTLPALSKINCTTGTWTWFRTWDIELELFLMRHFLYFYDLACQILKCCCCCFVPRLLRPTNRLQNFTPSGKSSIQPEHSRSSCVAFWSTGANGGQRHCRTLLLHDEFAPAWLFSVWCDAVAQGKTNSAPPWLWFRLIDGQTHRAGRHICNFNFSVTSKLW